MGMDYKNTQAAFREELERLARFRERVSSRLARVDRQIQAVTAASKALDRAAHPGNLNTVPQVVAVPPTPQPDFEITGSIRDLLKGGAELSAPQIREALVTRGWKDDGYTNPLAIIHTVLKRLVKNGDLGVSQNPG